MQMDPAMKGNVRENIFKRTFNRDCPARCSGVAIVRIQGRGGVAYLVYRSSRPFSFPLGRAPDQAASRGTHRQVGQPQTLPHWSAAPGSNVG